MNKLVLIALRKPYTFIVLSILIVVFGTMAVLEAPTDVFPNIQMPVSSVVWLYDGLMPQETEGRITRVFEQLLDGPLPVEDIARPISQRYRRPPSKRYRRMLPRPWLCVCSHPKFQ